QVVVPVAKGGPRIRYAAFERSCHEGAERGAGDVIVDVAALNEIHRHVERPVDISLKAEALLEGEGQLPRPIGIGVAPDLGPERAEAVGLAFGEGRVGEDGGGDRL